MAAPEWVNLANLEVLRLRRVVAVRDRMVKPVRTAVAAAARQVKWAALAANIVVAVVSLVRASMVKVAKAVRLAKWGAKAALAASTVAAAAAVEVEVEAAKLASMVKAVLLVPVIQTPVAVSQAQWAAAVATRRRLTRAA